MRADPGAAVRTPLVRLHVEDAPAEIYLKLESLQPINSFKILDELPDPDAVVIPYGGGGLTVGIASAIRPLRPQTKIFTAGPETGAALAAALAAGEPTEVEYQASFVDGSGSRRVLDTMWPLVRPLIDDAFAIPLADTEPMREPVLPGRGESDYERYLRTDELLALQKTPDERVHHDELLFQTVHQASELWLKLACTEVDAAAQQLERDELAPAQRLLRRAVLCLQYVTTQLEMLIQMDPWEYQQIRVVLGHGSGFDSPGFRRVSHATQRVWRAFDRLVAQAGLELTELYRHGREHEELYELAELLTEWDEGIWVWRFRHYSIVSRALGEQTIGTQGTPVRLLGKLIAQRQLPKLWETRSRLVELFDAERAGDG